MNGTKQAYCGLSKVCLGFCFSVLLGVSGFAQVPSKEPPSRLPMEIVVSLPYLAEIVSEVTCRSPSLKVRSLVPPGTDEHSYQLTPADRAALSTAHTVVITGAGLEPWAEALQPKTTGNKKNAAGQQWIVLARELTFAPAGSGDGAGLGVEKGNKGKKVNKDGHSHSHAHSHEHASPASSPHGEGWESDPHIWHSPQLVAKAAHTIAKKIGGNCADSYAKQLDKVADELRAMMAAIPKEQRVVGVTHDAFGYFGREFGIDLIPVLGLSSQGSLTAQGMGHVIDRLKARKVKVIFAEHSGSEPRLKAVAKEVGARLGGTLYASGLGEPGSGAETIPQMWRRNVEIILAGLRS